MANVVNGQPWSAITCVPARSVPARRRRKRRLPNNNKWRVLIAEIALRLEQTKRRDVLVIPFEDDKLGRLAYKAVQQWIRNTGNDIELWTSRDGDSRIVFVRRGPGYEVQK